MKITLMLQEIEEKNIEFSGKVSKLLEKLSINPETVLVVKNDELVNQDENLSNNDNIKIVGVVSGG